MAIGTGIVVTAIVIITVAIGMLFHGGWVQLPLRHLIMPDLGIGGITTSTGVSIDTGHITLGLIPTGDMTATTIVATVLIGKKPQFS